MEVITGAEAPEYLRGPYARKEGIAGATTKSIVTLVKGDTRHKRQDAKVKSCPNKDSTKSQNNHKRLEKNSENVESETESEGVKPVPVGPKKG